MLLGALLAAIITEWLGVILLTTVVFKTWQLGVALLAAVVFECLGVIFLTAGVFKWLGATLLAAVFFEQLGAIMLAAALAVFEELGVTLCSNHGVVLAQLGVTLLQGLATAFLPDRFEIFFLEQSGVNLSTEFICELLHVFWMG